MPSINTGRVVLLVVSSLLFTAARANAQELPPATIAVLDARSITFAIRDVDQVAPRSGATSFQLRVSPQAMVPSSRPPTEFVSLYASFSALQLLDVHSTTRAVNGGAREWNPLVSGVASHPVPFLLVKGAATVATVYLTEKLRKRNRVAAIALMVGLDCVYAAIVAHNYAKGPSRP